MDEGRGRGFVGGFSIVDRRRKSEYPMVVAAFWLERVSQTLAQASSLSS
jgi:hypothetical protein